MWHSYVIVSDNVGSLGWETSLKIESDGSVVVSFSLFDFSSLGFLVGLNQPLEVVLLEFSHIWVVLFLCNLNAFIPPVQFLVHSHGFLHFIILQENSLSSVELLLQDCKLSLHSEVLSSLSCSQLVDLSQIVSLGYIA